MTIRFKPNPATMSSKELEPEALVKILKIGTVHISASGDKVVYTTFPGTKEGDHNVSQIHLATPGKKHSSKPLTSGLYNDNSPHFSPQDSLIAFVSDRAKQGESSAIYLVASDGPGEPYPITSTENKGGVDSFKWSPCGQFIAFLSPDEKTPEKEKKDKEKDDVMVYGEEWPWNRLRVVHIKTKEVRTIIKADVHVTGFVWGEDSKEIVYLTERTPELNSSIYYGKDIGVVDLMTDQTEVKYHFPGIINEDDLYGGLVYKNEILYFSAPVTPKSCCSSLTIFSLNLGLEEPELKRFVNNTDFCVGSIHPSTEETATIAVQHGLEDEIHSLDKDGKQTKLYSGLGLITAYDAHIGPKGTTTVLSKSDINTPLELYSVSDSADPIPLSSHNSGILDFELATETTIHTKHPDGTLCDGVLHTPSRESKKPYPVLVFVHGGPYYRSTVHFTPDHLAWIPHLLSAGYAVLLPNYRGGSGHGEDYAAPSRGGTGTTEYEDVMVVLRTALKQHKDLDPKRVAIGGWSQGGFLSYLSTVRGVKAAADSVLRQQNGKKEEEKEEEEDITSPLHFRASICGAGVTDWDMITMSSDAPAFESEICGQAPWSSLKQSTKARHGSAIWEMTSAASAVGEALSVKKTLKKGSLLTPTLIAHGEKDARVPLSQAIAFRRGCEEHSWPVEMAVYPRGPHRVTERRHVLDMLKRVRRFLDLNLA